MTMNTGHRFHYMGYSWHRRFLSSIQQASHPAQSIRLYSFVLSLFPSPLYHFPFLSQYIQYIYTISYNLPPSSFSLFHLPLSLSALFSCYFLYIQFNFLTFSLFFKILINDNYHHSIYTINDLIVDSSLLKRYRAN